MKFLHAAAPSKYPLEPGLATTAKLRATAGSLPQAQTTKSGPTPTLDQVMTKIKNIVLSPV